MLGKRIINTGADACTTDTTQILDAGSTQSTALYRFEDNVNDTSNSTGKFSKGAEFNGSNSLVTVSSSLPWSSSFSISMWLKPSSGLSASNYYIPFYQKGYDSSIGGTGLAFYMYGYVLRPWIGSIGGNYYNIFNTGTLTADQWNHVVLTRTYNSQWELFLNGSSLGTYTAQGLTNDFSDTEYYFGGFFGAAYRYNGVIDQARIFNKALSSSEVTTLYNETTSTANTLQVLGDTSCIATYTFEGNANDLSTNYNGTASNVRYDYSGTASNITYATGKFDKGAVFNGSNSVIDIENMRTVMGNNFAVSLWVKTPSTFASSGYPAILSMYGYTGSGSAYGWDIEYNNSNKITFYWVSSSGVGNYILSSSLSTDTWYHVVAQKDSSSANLYINGQLDNDSTYGSAYGMYYNNFNRMTIGAKRLNYGSTSGHISGMVDQVRLFTKQLNPGEINSLYNETATSAASATIDNPSTIAYYKMQDATDETGSYNGTPTSVDFNVQGKYGFAGKFDGYNSAIDVNNVSGLNNLTEISVSLWFNWDDSTSVSNYNHMVNIGDMTNIANGDAFGIAIGDDGGSYNRVLYGYFPEGSSSTGQTVTANTWHHVVITYSGTTVKYYYDNSLIATQTKTSLSLPSSGNGIFIGHYKYNGNHHFKGFLDQIRIFNKAISASEVTALYNEIQCANTIDTPESYFNTKLYTGNGSTQALTGVGFAPAFVWIKARSVGYSHSLQDTVRGPGTGTSLYSDLQSAQGTYGSYGQISAFGTDGFTVASGGHGTYPTAQVNQNGVTYASWNWKGASSSVTNNVGTITSTVSASPESGFSIVKYTATGTIITNTVGHGLTTKPSLIIQKGANTTSNWFPITDVVDGSVDYLMLNSNGAKGDMSGIYADFSINDTTFTNWYSNTSGEIITYCFANVDGYQRIGSYIGNGSTTGPYIYTGFEPAWIMIKRTDAAGAWNIFDNKRNSANPRNSILQANVADQEYTNVLYNFNFYTNGFQSLNSNNDWNASGGSYIFIAIAANPDTTEPTKANSFKTKIYTGNGSTRSITDIGFKPDFTWIKKRANDTKAHRLFDSVRGPNNVIYSNLTNVAATPTDELTAFIDGGFSLGNASAVNDGASDTYVAWSWKGLDHDRNLATINNDGSIPSVVSANPAAGFSVVKWIGTGVDGTKIGHGLQGSPEMIITKGLSNATSWVIGVGNISGLSINDYFTFTSYAKANSSTFYQAYSTNTFQVGVSAANEMNKSSSNQYISYCFRTIAGHSKVGKYTGTGVSGLEIALDFSPSFLLVKGAGATGWILIDNQRPTPGGNYELYANLTNIEDTSATSFLLGTNKFTVNSTGTWHNTNGTDYIYLAIK